MWLTRITRDSLLFLIIIYFAQETLDIQGSIISQMTFALIILISSVFFVKCFLLKEKRNNFFRAWTILLLVNIFGFIFTGELSDSNHLGMFKGIILTLLSFYPFYYFSAVGQIHKRQFIWMFFILLPMSIYQFFIKESELIMAKVSNSTNVVNNVAYKFVALMPFVFLIKRSKLLSAALMLLLFVFIVQGAKRGAMISGSLGIICFFFYQIFSVDKRKRAIGYFLGFLTFVVLALYAYYTYTQNEFLVARMESIGEGNSSGRDEIYLSILNAWYNSDNIFTLLFGFGFAGSIQISGGTYAHNDWLELLSNFGLVGVAIYLYLFYSVVKYSLNKNWTLDKRVVLITIILLWSFATLFSMWYTSLNGCTPAILLGYIMGSKKNYLL